MVEIKVLRDSQIGFLGWNVDIFGAIFQMAKSRQILKLQIFMRIEIVSSFNYSSNLWVKLPSFYWNIEKFWRWVQTPNKHEQFRSQKK